MSNQHAMRLSSESDRQADQRIESSSDLSNTDQEQAQALLEKDEVDTFDPGHQRRRRPHIGIVIAAIVVVAVAIVGVNSLFFFQKNSDAILPTDPSISSRRPNDYTLNPTWNFNAAPTKREYHWTVSDQIPNPDGVYRPMMLINNQFPGPLVEVNEGDTVVVHIDNQAANATTIHWHGIYQLGTNSMDGTVGVTQCPIAPGTQFTYEFKIEGQSGTYWYHAHHAIQTSDGLLGPLIVHTKDEKELQKIQYASDRVVMVQDYYHDPSAALLMKYLEPDNENAEPVPDGALINGQNLRDCNLLPHRECNAENATVPTFDLTANENHRLRFINVGAFAEFQIEIDQHDFAITEVDGTNVWPLRFHRLNINPAQRYSIIVSANNSSAESYWLRARMLTHCFKELNPELEPEIRAIINYQQPSPVALTPIPPTPASHEWSESIEVECRDINTTSLKPIIPIPAPPKPDASFYIRTNFEIGAWKLSRGFFNSSSFRPNILSPVLHRVIDGLETSNASYTTLTSPDKPTGFSVFAPLPFPEPHDGIGINTIAYDPSHELILQTPTRGSVIDLILTNFDDGAHPLHLHGHKFFILGQGAGYPPSEIMNLASDPTPEGLDLTNPLRRDTTTIPAYGWVHLRVVLDNPGAWLFHCHVSWHFEAGMGMVVLAGIDDMEQEITTESGRDIRSNGWLKSLEQGREVCSRPGAALGRGPDDSIWYGFNDNK